MSLPAEQRRDGASLDPVARMYAQDAHASVTLLSLLMFLWGAIWLLTAPMKPLGPWSLLQAVSGAIALAYFVATRRRPRVDVAVGVALVMIGYGLVVVPWTAIVWCNLGRPWEAFTVPQLGMVSVALVVPRYFWLGVTMLALFAGETLFVYVYAAHIGVSELTPPTEPYFSFFFAILGVGLLTLREQRRQLALRHIRMAAERDALHEVGPVFGHFREQLGRQLATLSTEVRPLHDTPGASRLVDRIDRAVDRLASLTGRIDGLLATGPGRAAHASAARDGATPPVASEAERQLLARDAHAGTTVFVAMLAATTVFLMWQHDVIIGAPVFPFAAAEAVLVFGLLVYVLATRRRPSERRATAIVVVLLATLLPLLTWNEQHLLAAGRPYAPFIGHKFLMVGMALAAGSRLRLGIVLNVLTAASAVATFYALDLSAHREQISLTEPWVTLVFMVIGVVLLVMRERRRLASIELLREEAAAVAEQRRARLVLALRDQLNSPLQSLLASAAVLELDAQRTDGPRVRGAVEALIALSHELTRLEDTIATEPGSVSFDAARELTST